MAAEAHATIVDRPLLGFEVPASRQFPPQRRVKYDATTVALRILRLVAVASIFAFVLTARTVMPTHAYTDDPAADPSPADVDLSPADIVEPAPTDPPPADIVEPAPTDPPPADIVEPAPTDPPPTDPPAPTDPPPTDPPAPTDPPPTDPPAPTDPPPADAVEPAPTDPPPADTPGDVVPSTDPPIAAEPPPADAVEPAPTDPPPADTPGDVVPPTDPPIAAEPPPADAVEPAPIDPAESDSTVSPVPDPATTFADPADSDPSAAEPAPPVPSTHRSPEPVPPVAENPAQTATAPVTAIVRTLAKTMDLESDVPAQTMAFHSAVAAGVGLAAGLVVTNQAPSSVAVAIEFGRAGGGWAGAIVFNLWLRRQMRERRISQRQLAALAGIDHSTISRLLGSDRQPSLTTATKLTGALRQVQGEQAGPDTADYFERTPEETVFPARRVELALRADELLDAEQVRRLMNIYLNARRRHQALGTSPSAPSRAGPARAAPDPRR
jgi:transcriptional regulator with XRE-family HTH domain